MSHWLSVVSSFHSTDDYLTRTLPEERWIVKHLIPAGGLVTLYGKPKCGKSFFALGLAASVSDGHPWFLMPEFTVDVPGPVVFLQLDTPPSIWTEYIEGVVGGGDEFKQVYWADSMDVENGPFDILKENHVEWLRRALQHINPVMIICDSIREMHRANENESHMMATVIGNLRRAAEGTAIVLLAHARKGLAGAMVSFEDIIDSVRGSSYLAGRVDIMMRLQDGVGTKTKKAPKEFAFRGRTRGIGDDVVKLWQDTDTGLLHLDEPKHTLLDYRLVRDARNLAMRDALKRLKDVGGVSERTAYRHLERLGLSFTE